MGYDISEICLNGHVRTDTVRRTGREEKFCSKCGEPTIIQCPECNTPIRGEFISDMVVAGILTPAPSYCHNCGSAFPWTSRAMESALEIAETIELTETERIKLKDDFESLTKEGPKTQVAIVRIKSILSKAAKPTGDAIKSVLTSVVSEAIKKALWG